MKKVLIFSTAYTPFVGGAEVAIKEITDHIKTIEFDMITLRFDKNLPAKEKIGNVNVHRIGFTKDKPNMSDLVAWPLKINKFIFPFLAYYKARQLHRERQYDMTWAMMAAYAGFAASFFKKHNPDLPYLLTLQEGDPIDYIKKKVRFVYGAFEQIFLRADAVQTISHYLAAFARELGVKNEIKVVPNGVDLKKFTQEFSVVELEELKKKVGKEEGDFLLIHTGRFVLKNAVDDIIKSLSSLPRNVKLLLIGNGPDENKLRDLVKKFDLEERVIFYGFVNNEDLPKYLKISDIFIRPSLSEGLGISFLEAMAVSVPVIATPVGGIPDFLIHEKTGRLCGVRNPDSIAEQVKFYLDNPEKKNEIILTARKMIEEQFSWDKVSKEMEKIFIDLTK